MKIPDRIVGLIFPRKCIFCRKDIIGSSKVCICTDCMMTLTAEDGYVRTLNDGRECIYALRYAAAGVSSAIKRFKFNNRPQYAVTLGELLYLAIRNRADVDVISYVPVSTLRRMKRGYDQSRLLAEYIAKRMNKPVEAVLKKVRHNRKQSTLNESEKKTNVNGVYKAINKNVVGKRIILIDDVVTTGSTICECGKVLNATGIKNITYAAVASAEKSRYKHK